MDDNMNIIEPIKSGTQLLEEIKNTSPGKGVAIWWLGQSGFVIKSNMAIVYIDIYLSEQLTEKYKDSPNPHIRMTRAPFRGTDIFDADLVISTHRHSDHMDRPTVTGLLDNCPDAKFIFPTAHKDYVSLWGDYENRLIPAVVDEEIILEDLVIIPQPAKHEKFEFSQLTGYPYMSYIIKSEETVLYHSGDTLPYSGMVERVKKHGVDVLLLPINGRDKRRHSFGTAGNFTPQEALCFAELAGAKMLIPHHYDMFTFNTADINEFRELATELYPDLDCQILSCGERKFL